MTAVVTDVIRAPSRTSTGIVGASSLQLSYEPNDPLAVWLLFPNEGIEWSFARELLAAGLKEHAGEGKVRVWPGVAKWGRKPSFIHVEIEGRRWTTIVQLSEPWVSRFLLATYVAVPRGAEAVDVDRCIKLLREWA